MSVDDGVKDPTRSAVVCLRDVTADDAVTWDDGCSGSGSEQDEDSHVASTSNAPQISTGVLQVGGTPSNVRVENSSDVHVGSRLIYNAPVTVNQCVHVLRKNDVIQDGGLLRKAIRFPMDVLDPKENTSSQVPLSSLHQGVEGTSGLKDASTNVSTRRDKPIYFCQHRRACLAVILLLLIVVIIVTLIIYFTYDTGSNVTKHTVYPPTTVAGLATGRNFNLQNNLGYTVWVGILGNAGKGQPDNGGFTLKSGERRTVFIPDGWGGRFWARTECNFDGNGHGHCVTGDCGNKLECNGAGGDTPATLVEITLSDEGGLVVYSVSLVDGFNVPIRMIPTVGSGSGDSCTTAGCSDDLNRECPEDLKVLKGGNVVACKSSCVANHTAEYCCLGDFNNPNVCKSSPSAEYFKEKCPRIKSYAHDGVNSGFSCQNTDYDIIFG